MHTHTQPFYCSSEVYPGPPGWAGTRKIKPGRLKPIWIYWSKRWWVAVASAGIYASLHLIPDNHANIPPLSFLQAGCPSWRPTNSVKALKATMHMSSHQYNLNMHSVKLSLWVVLIDIHVDYYSQSMKSEIQWWCIAFKFAQHPLSIAIPH